MKASFSPRLFFKSILSWDFAFAAVGAIVLGVFVFGSERPLEDTGAIRASAIAVGTTLAFANIVSLRWVTDRMKGSAYGELIRSHDADESEVIQPYSIIVVTCFVTSVLGILAVVIQGELPRWADALLLTVLFFFGLYSLLGSASLVRLTLVSPEGILEVAARAGAGSSRAARNGAQAQGRTKLGRQLAIFPIGFWRPRVLCRPDPLGTGGHRPLGTLGSPQPGQLTGPGGPGQTTHPGPGPARALAPTAARMVRADRRAPLSGTGPVEPGAGAGRVRAS